MWAVPQRWAGTTAQSHRGVSRVDVWAFGEKIAETDDFIDGTVTEKWVTGIRSTLSLRVPPRTNWLTWLGMRAPVLIPYSGISWGTSEYLLPLGLYPVVAQSPSLPDEAIDIDADDSWQRIVQDDFLYQMPAYTGKIKDVAAQLMQEVGIGWPLAFTEYREGIGLETLATDKWQTPATVTVTATSDADTPQVVWDKSRHDTISGLVESIGADAYVDRLGRLMITDHSTSPGGVLADGENGTVITFKPTQEWEATVNQIAVTSSNIDIDFEPAIVRITDPAHPAHESRIGIRTLRYSSPLVTTREQALQAGEAMLAKRAAPALSWTVTCVPDTSRMPGDLITLTTRLGTTKAVVQEVRHPLGGGPQSLTLGGLP